MMMIVQEDTLAGRNMTNGGRALRDAGNQRACIQN